ncbi:MAG TPA: hypothetical protein VGY55_08265 [Pirellulales bacterium]|nr:hypothetical protein [Pirellulales bacterium]
MDWKEIKSQADADALMGVFGGFHDSCIREAHLWTGHWVTPELRMRCVSDNHLRVLFQRQFTNPSAIELIFEYVTRFNLVPAPENYDSIILAATLIVRDGDIFWSPVDDWTRAKLNNDEFTWVSAKKLRWREVDWLGKELRYGPGHVGVTKRSN